MFRRGQTDDPAESERRESESRTNNTDTVRQPKRTGLAAYAPPVPETLPERVKANRRPSARAAPTPPQPQAPLPAEAERRTPEREAAQQIEPDAKLLDAWRALTPEMASDLFRHEADLTEGENELVDLL